MKSSFTRGLGLLALPLSLFISNHAQALVETEWTYKANPNLTNRGSGGSDNLGSSIEPYIDLNGDGITDVLVGAKWHDAQNGGTYRIGRVRILDGDSKAVLFEYDGSEADDFVGAAVAKVGDVNFDGTDDFVVTCPGRRGSGEGLIISGGDAANGETVEICHLKGDEEAMSNFGQSLAYHNNTLFIGAPSSGQGSANGGAIYAYDLSDGCSAGESYSFRIDGPNGGSLGHSMAMIRDIDGDGNDELAIGEPEFERLPNDNPGRVNLYNPTDGSLLYTFDGIQDGDRFGISVADAGDTDSDGLAELYVGAEWATNLLDSNARPNTGSVTLLDFDGSGLNYVVDTTSFLPNIKYGQQSGEQFGHSITAGGDTSMMPNEILLLAVGSPGVREASGGVSIFDSSLPITPIQEYYDVLLNAGFGGELGATLSATNLDPSTNPNIIIGSTAGNLNAGGEFGLGEVKAVRIPDAPNQAGIEYVGKGCDPTGDNPSMVPDIGLNGVLPRPGVDFSVHGSGFRPSPIDPDTGLKEKTAMVWVGGQYVDPVVINEPPGIPQKTTGAFVTPPSPSPGVGFNNPACTMYCEPRDFFIFNVTVEDDGTFELPLFQPSTGMDGTTMCVQALDRQGTISDGSPVTRGMLINISSN